VIAILGVVTGFSDLGHNSLVFVYVFTELRVCSPSPPGRRGVVADKETGIGAELMKLQSF
jgi:hypothetical protein